MKKRLISYYYIAIRIRPAGAGPAGKRMEVCFVRGIDRREEIAGKASSRVLANYGQIAGESKAALSQPDALDPGLCDMGRDMCGSDAICSYAL